MDISKRALIIAAVITCLIFVTIGSRNINPVDSRESQTDDDRAGMIISNEMAENIYFGDESHRISMFGDSRQWDDEKNMSVDLNGDGQSDMNFAISPSKSEGINLTGSVKQNDGSWKSMNFWSSDLYRLFRNSLKDKTQAQTIKIKDLVTMDPFGAISLLIEGKYLVKGSSITDDDYVQIAVYDIDKDGLPEVFASVGNKLDGYVTAYYEVSYTGEDPFKYCGQLICN